MMRLPLVLLLLLFCAPLSATVELRIDDLPGEGFNDPTPFTPVDGNAARTLGQARLNALWRALLRYDLRFGFRVPLSVVARMDPLGGSAKHATLDHAGPNNFIYFTKTGTDYPVALANQIAGRDLDPDTSDIDAIFNSDVDGSTVLGSAHWHYGFSGPPANSNDQDFFATALHELLHGLGFITLLDADGSLPKTTSGAEMPDPFFLQLQHLTTNGPVLLSQEDQLARSAAVTSIDKLTWAQGTNPLMYAPNPYQPGSSVSHFDTSIAPDELMEPIATPTWHDKLAMAAMQDMGWPVHNPTASVPALDLGLELTGTTPTSNQTTLRLRAYNTGSGYSAEHAYLVVALPSGMRLQGSTTTGNNHACTSMGTMIRCALPTIPPLSSIILDLSLCGDTGNSANLTLNLSSPHSDTNPADNLVDYRGLITTCSPSATRTGGGSGSLHWLYPIIFALARWLMAKRPQPPRLRYRQHSHLTKSY